MVTAGGGRGGQPSCRVPSPANSSAASGERSMATSSAAATSSLRKKTAAFLSFADVDEEDFCAPELQSKPLLRSEIGEIADGWLLL